MTPKEFNKAYLNDAIECEKSTGIHHIATLTQAALESGWGKYAPGNMFFGIKDTDGVNGNEQLITTTEYTRSSKNPMSVFVSTTPVVRNGVKMFKHVGKDYFRKYSNPADSFKDHSKFFFQNKRYAKALEVRSDYNLWFEELQKAGYATDPNYAKTLKAVAKTIIKNL